MKNAITEGFATSTRSAHEISKENFEIAKAIGAETHEACKNDTKERLSKGVKQGFADEMEKQKENTRQFRDDAINLRGTKEVLSAQREFTDAIMSTIPGKRK